MLTRDRIINECIQYKIHKSGELGVLMKIFEFIIEGTEIFAGDGEVFAKRISKQGGPVIQMFITKDEWEYIKGQQANTEMMSYDLSTAEMIIKDMVKNGATVNWKTAADFNKDARDLESHRFANDPEVKHGFNQAAGTARSKAKDLTKAGMKVIK